MPDVSYIIRIEDNTGGGGGGRGGGGGAPRGVAQVGGGNASVSTGRPTDDGNSLSMKVVAATVLNQAARLTDQFVTYRINHVAIQTGSHTYQEKLSRAHSLGASAVNGIVATAMAAMAGGPMAALAALGSSAYSIGYGVWNERRDNQMQSTIEAVSRSMADRRSGVDNRNTEMLD